MADPTFEGLNFEVDDRNDPDAHRKDRFRRGWNDAVRGKDYGRTTLRKLTWQNLGWRIGKMLGHGSQETVERMYHLCVKLKDEAETST